MCCTVAGFACTPAVVAGFLAASRLLGLDRGARGAVPALSWANGLLFSAGGSSCPAPVPLALAGASYRNNRPSIFSSNGHHDFVHRRQAVIGGWIVMRVRTKKHPVLILKNLPFVLKNPLL